MGWVMGLEPVIKNLKTIGITCFCENRVQFRVQIERIFYVQSKIAHGLFIVQKEVAEVFGAICDVLLSQVGVDFPHRSII